MTHNLGLSLGSLASDFQVTEIPLYACSGSGNHRYLLIEKHGIHSDTVVQHLSQITQCSPRDIGWAGRKDKHAITRQYISIPSYYDPALTADEYNIANGSFRILERDLHDNKLQMGHLRGNRFTLQLNGLATDRDHAALARIQQEGMINYFGSQRFGRDNNNIHAAAAWQRKEYETCIDILCGDSSHGSGMTRALHRHFRSGLDPKEALARSGKSLRQFLASALQSEIFNAICNARIQANRGRCAQVGDLLMRNGPSAFHAREDELETLNLELNNRQESLSISAPLPGHKVRRPFDDILQEEKDWSADCAVGWDAFAKKTTFASVGQRRRIYINFLENPELACDNNEQNDSPKTTLTCALPSGSYVTVALDQLGIAWERSNPATVI